jgi:hypothetical protein
LISAVLTIIAYDISKHGLLLSMIQLGYSKKYLVNLFAIISVFASFSFLSVDMFFAPYSSYKIKVKLLEIAKNKFVASLKPRHLIYYDNWNILIGSRLSDSKIEYLLVDKATDDTTLTFFIKSATFFSQDYMNLNLEESVGNIKFKNGSIKLRFKSGLFSAPRSIVNVVKQEANEVFTKVSWHEIARRLRFLIICFILPFWFFIMFFASGYLRISSIAAFIGIVLSIIDVIPFNIYLILLFSLFLLGAFFAVYRKEK